MITTRYDLTSLLLCLLSLCLLATGCGRIPGLYDAAAAVSRDDSSQGGGGQGGALTQPNSDVAADSAAVDLPLATGGAGRDGSGGAGGSSTVRGSGGAGGSSTVLGSGGAGGSSTVLGSGGVGGGTTAGATGACVPVLVSAAGSSPADVLLVLDRSGSMKFNIAQECSCDPTDNPSVVCADTANCTTRWSSLATALDHTLASTPYLHWGLKLFPSSDGDACTVLKGVEVSVAADATSAINARIATTLPSGGTPTAPAILAATTYLMSLTDGSTKMILVATDGKPNCGGDSPSVYEDDIEGATSAIKAAFNAGFLVYVIGIDAGPSVSTLDTFAQAGGTGSHYAVESLDGLGAALSSISKAASCAFTLTAQAPDAKSVVVYLNKAKVPQSPTDGWSFGADTRTVLLHGTFCDQALSGSRGLVQALFSCGLPAPATLP